MDLEAHQTQRANRVAWIFLTGLLVVTLWPLPLARVIVKPTSLAGPLALAGALMMSGWYYRNRRHEPRLATALDCTGQLVAFTTLGVLLSYLVARLGYPLQDQALHAADRSLGLDWLGYLKAVNARPWLGAVFSTAYASFMPQIIILITVLSFSDGALRARIVLLAMMIAAITTITISGFAPALAMYVHLGLTAADYPNLAPQASFVHLADMVALRAGGVFALDIEKAQGIITFPSYHAALGLLLLIGAFANRWLRWPFLIVNVTMIAATPIDGGHYFVDVAAGLAIAAASYAAAGRLVLGEWPTANAGG